MPKVVSWTPEWLTRSHPGYELFAPKPKATNGTAAAAAAAASRDQKLLRTVATRDSEIFTAVGNEIRWADLSQLKEAYDNARGDGYLRASRGRQAPISQDEGTYRVLRLPTHGEIKQLSISPAGDFMAVATSHTIHVVVLPDPSLLNAEDTGPIKPKSFQLGPTAHVLEESPVASLVWHPLGYRGHSLITITKAGIIRLWELNRSDRSTFNEPALSVDLQKLANAESEDDKLSASTYGVSKGFSPDSVELEVASACFGDFPEQEGVHGWAPMTLWIATVEGGLYALCPFLPSKWQLVDDGPASTVLDTLASSINANNAVVNDSDDATADEQETAHKQVQWLSDLAYQDPLTEEDVHGDTVKVFSRPSSVNAVPLLQGPFYITPEIEEDFEITDLIVFTLKTLSDGTEEEPAEGVPAAVICLLTDTCTVHVCIDLEGIVGQWLPSNNRHTTAQELPEHRLLLVETLALLDSTVVEPSHAQSITPDVHTDYSFFVTSSSGVFYVSMEPWIRSLETELSEPQESGAGFRARSLAETVHSVVEKPIDKPSQPPTSCVVLENGNVGYLLLTVVHDEPYAVVLDAPEEGLGEEEAEIAHHLAIEGPKAEVRPPYQPPKDLYAPSQLGALIEHDVASRHKQTFKDEIKLSPANLELLVKVHKALSQETHQLGLAVSDLFRRCERLRDEFKEQISRAAELTTRIDAVTGDDEVPSDSGSDDVIVGNGKIEERLERVKRKQDELVARYEAVRRRMASVGGRELSDKESAWVEELETMDHALHKNARTLTDDETGTEEPAWQRLETVNNLKQDLASQAKAAAKESKGEGLRGAVKVPSGSRKQENAVVEELLERQTALVEAATTRLQELGISIPAPVAG